jgi:hypothetical protein
VALRERSILGRERAIDFVRANVDEPEGPRMSRELLPYALEQSQRAKDIRRNKIARAKDRAVDVRFGCEVEDSIWRRNSAVGQRLSGLAGEER